MADLKNTTINDTGYLQLPVGTTAQRPGSPVNGDTRFNSQFKVVESYVDGAWKYMPPIVESGMVLHLDAAEPASYPGTGTTWTDLSGNGNNGTLVNGVGYSSANTGSLVFDGSNDYVNLQNDADWNAFGDNITLEAVFMLTGAVSSYPRIIAKQFSGLTTASSCFQLGILNNQTFRFAVVTSSGNVDSASGSVTSNQIYHFVGTYDGSTMKRYVDGAEISSAAQTGNIRTSSEPLTLGSSYYQGSVNWHFPGNVYICRIYNRGLSAAEVAQNFNALRGRYGL